MPDTPAAPVAPPPAWPASPTGVADYSDPRVNAYFPYLPPWIRKDLPKWDYSRSREDDPDWGPDMYK